MKRSIGWVLCLTLLGSLPSAADDLGTDAESAAWHGLLTEMWRLDYESARARLAELRAAFPDSKRNATRIERQFAMIGRPAPERWEIRQWVQAYV